MYLSASVLGSKTARDLQARATAPVLRIGADKFARGDLAGIDCFNYHAAQTLSHALADLGVRNTADLFERVPPASLALPRIGAIALAVLGAAFELKRVGGDRPLENWMRKHSGTGSAEAAIVTFHTIKHREAAEQREEQRARKQRARKRSGKAHRLRVDRFTRRQESQQSAGA